MRARALFAALPLLALPAAPQGVVSTLTFDDAPTWIVFPISIGDVDGDGRPELAVARRVDLAST